jgi:hypothetical protein
MVVFKIHFVIINYLFAADPSEKTKVFSKSLDDLVRHTDMLALGVSPEREAIQLESQLERVNALYRIACATAIDESESEVFKKRRDEVVEYLESYFFDRIRFAKLSDFARRLVKTVDRGVSDRPTAQNFLNEMVVLKQEFDMNKPEDAAIWRLFFEIRVRTSRALAEIQRICAE